MCSQINLLQQSIRGSWAAEDDFGDDGVYMFIVRVILVTLFL